MHQHKHIPENHHIGLLCLSAETHIKDLYAEKLHRNNYMDASSFLLSYVKTYDSLFRPFKLSVLYVDSLGILL